MEKQKDLATEKVGQNPLYHPETSKLTLKRDLGFRHRSKIYAIESDILHRSETPEIGIHGVYDIAEAQRERKRSKGSFLFE